MTPTQSERSAALTYARKRWPSAHSLRYSGKCPSCKQRTEWSCQIDGDHPRGKDEETCVYLCTSCKWSNGGSRPIDNDELDEVTS